MFETSYSGQLWMQVVSVHHEYSQLTLATAGLLLWYTDYSGIKLLSSGALQESIIKMRKFSKQN